MSSIDGAHIGRAAPAGRRTKAKPVPSSAAPSRRIPVRRSLKAVVGALGAAAVKSPPDASTSAPPFRMPKVRVPTFPQRVVDVRDHGAVGDGIVDNQLAFASAIRACAQAGGGRVLVPAGTWVTGPIHLLSNVNFHLAEGAVVRFVEDPKRYLPPVFVRWGGQECFNFSPLIYARDCNNVAVTGRGTLVGNGRAWWPWAKQQQRTCDKLYDMVLGGVPVDQRVFNNGDAFLRPQFILPINCTNVLLDGFTIADGGGPFWNVHVAYCQNVVIRNVTIDAPDGPNSDGIVIDSSRNVLIEDCSIASGEDCVSLKSGMNEDGWRVGKPTENVIVRRIRATNGKGAMAIGSDMSGGVRNVFVHDCTFDGPSVGVRLKAARGRGGTVEHVYVRDITMGRIPGDAIQFTTEYPAFAKKDGQAPTFRNIDIRNVTCAHAKAAVRMVGLPDAPFQDIHLENVQIEAEEGLSCSACNRIDLVDVRITPQRGPVLSLRDGTEVLIQGLNSAKSASVFLDLRGRLTRNIRLRGAKDGVGRPTVVLGIDVPTDVLVHE